ncbi:MULTISPECIES: VIT1/CCC1 transporter family protein [Brevibacterium]|jgi:VIT1/CCC1 family predicted Fe2+/Mn2+ transporter|uniref:VIT1/CCC1 transporter family protein n=1 Tax=Brevibacterium salitolerans TaxID=1403566 RepID=A0ABP5IAJ5_9MICO|nr:VIT1/CCC1 transporter family protein [Brevibacterium sp.]
MTDDQQEPAAPPAERQHPTQAVFTSEDTLSGPDRALVRRWQKHLANERLEERVYRSLASRKDGQEAEILTALADAESRHQSHWRTLLGDYAEPPRRPSFGTYLLALLGRVFGSVFVLALAQQSESRSPYASDRWATKRMAADEAIHAEVVRALAQQSRARLSGSFRAAVFGANDGLVSNLALVLGVAAAGLTTGQVLLTGISGLLAGALSMGAGEYVSVRSQRELLEASSPDPESSRALPHLDIDANELALVFRARGLTPEEADARAEASIRRAQSRIHKRPSPTHRGDPELSLGPVDEHEELGTGLGAALSSFCFFASGAIIPILPYIFGMTGLAAVATASALVGIALLATGGVVGVLSGRPPLPRALRQLAIGFGAAAVTYALGLAFGTVAG